MKRVHQALALVIAAAALGLPLASHAQSSVTRAQVRADLIAAEQSGQLPQSDTSYPEPANYSAAAPHVFHHSHDPIAASYGPATNGSGTSGYRATRAHSPAGAPIGFDDIYRGQ
jgi:hypothetical protein